MRDKERILVVKLGDLGDVLLCEPALRSIQCGHPDTQVDFLTTPSGRRIANLIEVSGDILTMDRQPPRSPRRMPSVVLQLISTGCLVSRRSYNKIVLLHHLTTAAGTARLRALARVSGAQEVIGLDNGRGDFLTSAVLDRGFGAMHEAEYMLAVARHAGGVDVAKDPQLSIRPGLLPDGISPNSVVIAPVSGPYAPARDWPIDRFTELVASLSNIDLGRQIIVVGDDAAREAGARLSTTSKCVIDLTGRTTVEALVAIIASARLVVTNDSFPGHVADAVGTPVVSIFGPSNVSAWKPFRSDTGHPDPFAKMGRVMYANLPCSPCLYTGHRIGRRFGCPARTCLTEISSRQVLEAVQSILEETG